MPREPIPAAAGRDMTPEEDKEEAHEEEEEEEEEEREGERRDSKSWILESHWPRRDLYWFW